MDGDHRVVRVELAETDAVARVTGELDVVGADDLRQALEPVVPEGEGKPERVVLDLADCSFMDSSGLSVLIGLHKRCETAGVAFVVRNPNDKVFRVLDITGMAKVFTIER